MNLAELQNTRLMQKIAFLYTSDEQMETDVKIHNIYISAPKMKYSGLMLAKYM